MDRLDFFSPAKINLFFRALSRRKDEYCEVATLLCAIDWGDTLSIKPSYKDQFHSNHPSLTWDCRNLIWKALRLFRSSFSLSGGVEISLKKQIPIGGGLGGGSSNAATALWALNILSGSPASPLQLLEMSSELGSDVPFFFSQGMAYATGRGEVISSVDLYPLQGWVVVPPFFLSTAKVFQKLSEFSKSPDPASLLKRFSSSPQFLNDLEPIAFELEPRLALLKNKLVQQGFSQVWMSGSGSSLICLGDISPHPIEGVRFVPFRSLYRKNLIDWFVSEQPEG